MPRLNEWQRLLLLVAVSVLSSPLSAGDLPNWLDDFAAQTEVTRVGRIELAFTYPEPETAGRSKGCLSYASNGEAYTMTAGCGSVAFPVEEAYAPSERYHLWSDGVETWVCEGWIPADTFAEEFAEKSPLHDQVRGAISLRDPAYGPLPLTFVGLSPSAAHTWRELLEESELTIGPLDGGEFSVALSEVPKASKRYEGTVLRFAPGQDWPLVSSMSRRGVLLTYEGAVPVGDGWVPRSRITSGESIPVVVEVLSVQPVPEDGELKRPAFPEDMTVLDARTPDVATYLIADGRGGFEESLSAMQNAVRKHSVPAAQSAPAGAIEGRGVGRGPWFWGVNGLLAITVVVLLIVRRRAS